MCIQAVLQLHLRLDPDQRGCSERMALLYGALWKDIFALRGRVNYPELMTRYIDYIVWPEEQARDEINDDGLFETGETDMHTHLHARTQTHTRTHVETKNDSFHKDCSSVRL